MIWVWNICEHFLSPRLLFNPKNIERLPGVLSNYTRNWSIWPYSLHLSEAMGQLFGLVKVSTWRQQLGMRLVSKAS